MQNFLKDIQNQKKEIFLQYRDGLLSTQEYFEKMHFLTLCQKDLESGKASCLWDAIQ